MNRFFKYALVGLLTILPTKAFASDVYLLLGIEDSRKTHIHQNIVTKTGLHKTKPDNYHVTLACVNKVDSKDQAALKQYLKAQLKAKYPNFIFNQGKKKGQFAMSVGLKKAERYLVGGRNYNHCPLVFYVLPRHHDLLKEMNAYLSDTLPGFKSPSGKKYTEFAHDQQPHNYIPHMTIANTKYIDGQKIDRDEVIGKLNRNLGQAAKGLPDGEYRFKLRVDGLNALAAEVAPKKEVGFDAARYLAKWTFVGDEARAKGITPEDYAFQHFMLHKKQFPNLADF